MLRRIDLLLKLQHSSLVFLLTKSKPIVNMSNEEEFVDYDDEEVQVDTKADEKDTKK